MSESYRPSNGTEGETFIWHWCGRCKRDAAYRAGTGNSCPIVAATFYLDEDHPDYPPEWQYRDDEPVCTAFDDVTKPDPPDPRQMDMLA